MQLTIYTKLFCSVRIIGPLVVLAMVLEILAAKFKQTVHVNVGFIQTPPLNVFIWILFTISLSLLGWNLVSLFEPTLFVMISCIIIAQVEFSIKI